MIVSFRFPVYFLYLRDSIYTLYFFIPLYIHHVSHLLHLKVCLLTSRFTDHLAFIVDEDSAFCNISCSSFQLNHSHHLDITNKMAKLPTPSNDKSVPVTKVHSTGNRKDKEGFAVPDKPPSTTRSAAKREASKSVSSVDKSGTRNSEYHSSRLNRSHIITSLTSLINSSYTESVAKRSRRKQEPLTDVPEESDQGVSTPLPQTCTVPRAKSVKPGDSEQLAYLPGH